MLIRSVNMVNKQQEIQYIFYMKFVMNYPEREALNRYIFLHGLTTSMFLQTRYLPIYVILPALMSVK